MLDFGCGSGRVLRHMARYLPEGVALAGCDIHAPTIQWMNENYPPEVRLDVSPGAPPLPYESESFDLIYAVSVFSHLPDWAPWVLEMHRLLRPGGTLVASILGRALWDAGIAGSRGVQWDEDRTGLLVERYGSGFDDSFGPAVFASEWWLREHWGRALSIERFEPTGFALPDARRGGQAYVVARKERDRAPTAAELQEPSADPREARAASRGQWLAYEEGRAALTHATDLEQHCAELQRHATELEQHCAELQRHYDELVERSAELQNQHDELAERSAELQQRHDEVVYSRSWRLTGPLRKLAAKRRARG